MESKRDTSLYEGLWKELKNYLNVEIDVEQPENVASNLAYPGGMAAPVRIRLSNTAPTAAEHPRIVFTGISVRVRTTGGLDSVEWARQRQPMKEVSDRPAREELPANQQGYLVHSFVGSEFPETTPGELEWGDSLFPGQSVAYSFYVPVIYVPFVEFGIEANISRRHLFRFEQTLRVRGAV